MTLPTRLLNIQEFIWSSDLKLHAKMVALFLARCANGDADIAWPSQKRIADETGMSERSVRNQIDILEDRGWLIRTRGGLSAGEKKRVSTYDLTVPKSEIPTAGGAGLNFKPAGGAVGPTAGGADHKGGYKEKNIHSLSKTEKVLSAIELNLPAHSHQHIAAISVLLTNYGEKGVKAVTAIGPRQFSASWALSLSQFDDNVVMMAVYKHLEEKPGYWPTVAEIRANCIHYASQEKPKASAKRKTFKRPTLEDVFSYCRERSNSVDPQQFIDYYESNGWKVGRNAMKDWKAAIRTWEKSTNRGNNREETQRTGRKLSASEIGADNARRFEEQCRRDKEALYGEIMAKDGRDIRP